jgi:DNA-binding beta-propeller fold protein YncE
MPGGLALHANGDDTTPLWIADAWTLREFNRETGNCSNIHRCVLGVNGFTAPMTVNGDGTELIVSSWLGCVQVINPTTCELVECYDYREIGAKPVNSIRYHGEVVVAEHVSGSVFRAHDQSLLASGFTAPTGLAASNGDLWVADRGTGTVWWIAHDGIPLTEKIAVATGLAAPEGLVALNDRTLLVAETDAGRLTRIDLRSGSTMVLAESLDFGLEAAAGMPPSWGFTDISIDAVNNLAYVSSDVANLVYVIDLPAGRHHGDMMDEGAIIP